MKELNLGTNILLYFIIFYFLRQSQQSQRQALKTKKTRPHRGEVVALFLNSHISWMAICTILSPELAIGRQYQCLGMYFNVDEPNTCTSMRRGF